MSKDAWGVPRPPRQRRPIEDDFENLVPDSNVHGGSREGDRHDEEDE